MQTRTTGATAGVYHEYVKVGLFRMVEHCLAAAQALVQGGGDYEEREKQLPPAEKFQDWQPAGFYTANIRIMCRQSAAQAG